MADMNGLLAKLESKAAEIDQIEAAFMRLTVSRVLSPGKAEIIAGNVVTLMSRIGEISKQRKEASDKFTSVSNDENSTPEEIEAAQNAVNEDGKNILQSYLDFAFKHEKDLIYGLIATVFDIDIEDVEHVPLSCIYECIVKDKVMRSFLPRLAILDARNQSDILPNAAPFPQSPPTPSTLNREQRRSLMKGKN